MLSFWEFLRIRCEHSIAPGCYRPFTYLLNVCYFLAHAFLSGRPLCVLQRQPNWDGRKRKIRAWRARRLAWRMDQQIARGYLLLRNLRGRITQSTNRPINAAAAMIAIIPWIPPNCDDLIIRPWWYALFTQMLTTYYAPDRRVAPVSYLSGTVVPGPISRSSTGSHQNTAPAGTLPASWLIALFVPSESPPGYHHPQRKESQEDPGNS